MTGAAAANDASRGVLIGVTVAAMAVAAALGIAKLAAFLVGGSMAMLASAVDSALDFVASAMIAFAVRTALRPADREHRFGHGKAEALAGFGQALLVAGSALFLGVESIRRLIAPEPVGATALGLGVIAVSLVLTITLVIAQRRIAARTGSLAVAADSLHYLTDIASNLAVVAALVASGVFAFTAADPLIGLGIAALIGWGAVEILRRAFDQLMDRELPDEARERIRALALGQPGVLGVHDLRTRRSGRDVFIQFHVELDPALPLARAHAIADRAMSAVERAFPGAEVLIHQDPAGIETPHSPVAH